MQDPDLELLLVRRAGSVTTGNRLHRQFNARLRRFFGNKAPLQEIDDLIQQTWLELTQSLKSKGESVTPKVQTLRAYLFGIARHVVLRYHRKHARRIDFDPEVDSLESLMPSLSQQLSLEREVTLYEQALHSLPIGLQMLFEAHHVEGFTGPEIAVMFDIPEGTVRSRLAKARLLLEEAREKWIRKTRASSSTL